MKIAAYNTNNVNQRFSNLFDGRRKHSLTSSASSRFLVVRGQLWRLSDPMLDAKTHDAFKRYASRCGI